MLGEIEQRIHQAYQDPSLLSDSLYREAVEQALELLDTGQVRVAERRDGQWQVHAWLHEAILLYFRISPTEPLDLGPFAYADKIPLKSRDRLVGVRVVPPATVRFGAYVESGAVLMPCYVNLGAYVGARTMVDTWATVGSCAQIGTDVHIAGGAGVGGVLEPPGARPVIIEDGAFIGSRCVVVEGTIVGEEAVLGAGVIITSSTPIIDVTGRQEAVHRGRVPPRAVVIPGVRPKTFAAGTYYISCAIIIGERKQSTDRRTSLNQALREFDVAV